MYIKLGDFDKNLEIMRLHGMIGTVKKIRRVEISILEHVTFVFNFTLEASSIRGVRGSN